MTSPSSPWLCLVGVFPHNCGAAYKTVALERHEAASLGEMFSSCLTGRKACEVNCEAEALLQKQCDLSEATQSEAPVEVDWVSEEGESVRGGAQAPQRQEAWAESSQHIQVTVCPTGTFPLW